MCWWVISHFFYIKLITLWTVLYVTATHKTADTDCYCRLLGQMMMNDVTIWFDMQPVVEATTAAAAAGSAEDEVVEWSRGSDALLSFVPIVDRIISDVNTRVRLKQNCEHQQHIIRWLIHSLNTTNTTKTFTWVIKSNIIAGPN